MANEKREMTSDERDLTQRQFGYFGLSGLLHAGVLIAVCLAPSFRTVEGSAAGTEAGTTVSASDTSAISAGDRSTDVSVTDSGGGNQNQSSHEVMLADSNDSTAVELPAQAPSNNPAPPPQPTTVAKKIEVKKPADVKPEAKSTQKTKFETASAAKIAAPVVESEDVPQDQAVSEDTQVASTAETETPAAQAIEDTPTAQAETSTQAASTTQTSPAAQAVEDTPPSQAETSTQAKDDAVPLQVALPENEALTTEQENALTAPTAKTIAKNEIPSNAVPIETVSSTGSSTGPGFAQGRSIGNGGVASAAPGQGSTQSRGAGTGYNVPLGVPVRDARSLIAAPGNKPPTYPLADRLANRQGTTVLVAKVTSEGLVEDVTVETSSGSRTLDQSAAQAFKSWKYKPGQEGYIRQPMQFQLKGNAQEVPAQLQRQ